MTDRRFNTRDVLLIHLFGSWINDVALARKLTLISGPGSGAALTVGQTFEVSLPHPSASRARRRLRTLPGAFWRQCLRESALALA